MSESIICMIQIIVLGNKVGFHICVKLHISNDNGSLLLKQWMGKEDKLQKKSSGYSEFYIENNCFVIVLYL